MNARLTKDGAQHESETEPQCRAASRIYARLILFSLCAGDDICPFVEVVFKSTSLYVSPIFRRKLFLFPTHRVTLGLDEYHATEVHE
jgi:hypothetical protein